MPATLTGRGAQVVLDPAGDTAKAARGAYAATLELNLAKQRTDTASGALADGSTSDGRTSTAGKAVDFVTSPGSSAGRLVSPPAVASVGNGADLTEDTLQTLTVPAGTLKVVGDRLRIVAGGTFAASTDTKQSRVRVNGAGFGAATGNTAPNIRWSWDITMTKTGANTQMWTAMVGTSLLTTTAGGTSTTNDVNAIVVTVTGQNLTNPVANSITCDYVTVEYLPA